MKFVLFSNSNTQRVTVKLQGDTVLIAKDWRKSSKEEWTTGKGITIPTGHLLNLIKVLACKSEDELNSLLAENHYEVLKEEDN